MLIMIMQVNKLIAAVFITAAFFSEAGCKIKKDRVCAYRVLYNWEVYNVDQEKMIEFSDSIDFYLKKDYVVSRIPVYSSNVTSFIDTNNSIINERLDKEEVSYKYCFFLKESSVALFFDSIQQNKATIINKDSFLNEKLFKSFVVISQNDKLLSEEKDQQKTTRVYFAIDKPDITYPDTSILIFSSSRNCLDFSLGSDSTKPLNKPLIEIRGKFNSYFDTGNKKQIPVRELFFQIKPITIQIPDDVNKLFELNMQ